MLSPEQIEEAGERVAAVYREIEARMLDHMARAMAQGWGKGDLTVTEAALLAQAKSEELRAMVARYRPTIDAAVLEVVERCLEASDADDVARAGGDPQWPAQIDATVKGMAEVLARDNIQMAEGAKRAFLNASIEAVTAVNSGTVDRERALHRAVRKLERDGIGIVTYQNAETGRVTVENKADVAVRRHIRTQISQDAMAMSMARMERLGITLVEVSSHEGSRPSHAEWQGQCYSLEGEQVIDGHKYADLREATRCGQVDGLGGANCRHSFGPYRHGAPQMYEPDPKHPSGLPGGEVYELEQGQRYRERKIRESKREVRGARILYERDKTAANLTALNKAEQTLRNRQAKMRDYIDQANAKSKTGKPVLFRKPDREWAGDMPESKAPAPAKRTLPQLLQTKSARDAMRRAGMDAKAVTAAVGEEMKRRGGTVADFKSLTAGEQQGIFRRIVRPVAERIDGTAKAAAGKHAATPQRYEQELAGKGLSPEHARGIAEKVASCRNAAARRAFEDALSDLSFDSLAAPSREAYYDHTTQGITLNMEEAAAGFAARPDKAPYQSLFHEAGHYIDHRLGGYATGEVKRPDMIYRNMDGAAHQAGMAQTARKEVTALIEEIMERESCEEIDAMDILSMKTQDIPSAEQGGLRDIISGATKGRCGFGHSKKYWLQTGDFGLATETFAHFYETTMANPKALETLRRYLPETYALFESIIGGTR